jgi:uncharacterized integral membrane protein
MMRMEADQATEPQKEYAGTGIIGWLVVGVVLATAAVIYIAQNVDRVDVEWLWWGFQLSVGVIALGGVLLGVLGAVAIGVIVRRRRRRALQDAHELATLRRRVSPDHGDNETAAGREAQHQEGDQGLQEEAHDRI